MMVLRAVVFDCDGVLIDSEALAWEAWRAALGRYGVRAPESESQQLLGRSAPEIYRHFAVGGALPAWPMFREHLDKDVITTFERDLRPHGDAVEFLAEVERAGLRVAIASSSDAHRLHRSLEIVGLDGRFETVVAGDEVLHGKPAPDLYLEAGRRLGLPPTECLAVEDSSVGVAAAVAAGMRVIAVVRQHTRPEDITGAARIVDVLRPELLADVASTPAVDASGSMDGPPVQRLL